MAELIDKHTIIRFHMDEKDYENLTDYGRGYADAMKEVLEIIDSKPFITESEIRAMAIDEFAEKLKPIYKGITIAEKVIDEIAEQLKEE